MLRAFYTFLIIAALSAIAVWLADNPGELVMHWRGYEVRTSFVIGVGLLAAVAFLVLFVYRLGSGLVGSPARVSSYLDMRRRKRGFLALSRGMVAVAAGDAVEARRYAGRAQKLLDETPLTLLLAAQAAQLGGQEDAATRHFEAMLASPETAFLGLRGLFVQARRAGDRTRALDIARRAFNMRPNTPWAAQAVFEIETAQEDWSAALGTLDRSLSAKLISRNDARRRRTVLLTAQAVVAADAVRMQTGDARKAANEAALRGALKAVSLDPSFVPAVALAATLCGATGRVRKGAKLVEDAWARAPHPDLAHAYMDLVEGESGYDRFKRMKLLAGRNRDHLESRVALARAAIGARDWLAARGALEPFVGESATERPTQRVCELMAEIEEGELGNRGSAREWLARALHAPEDPAWTGEGWRSAVWSPINPVTGEFDALEWRVPGLRLGRAAQMRQVDEGNGERDAAGAPVDEDRAPAATKTGRASEGRPADPAPEMVDDEGETELVLPPPPDDPGPDHSEDQAEDAAFRGI